MNDTKLLPSSIVGKLREAGITEDSEIFFDNNQWVYRKRNFLSNDEALPSPSPIDSLGPFEICSVDLTVVLNPLVGQYSITSIENQILDTQHQPRGTYSPLALITLQGSARTAANIPDDATHFCWLYPSNRSLTGNDVLSNNTAVHSLVQIGGFAYFHVDPQSTAPHRPLQVNALIEFGSNGLVFDGPYRWKNQFTEQLWRQNRFHPVTIPFLKAKGARYFGFLNPSEMFYDYASQTIWTASSNGAFVYLFNDDHSPHEFDCYFTVADNCLGVSASDDLK